MGCFNDGDRRQVRLRGGTGRQLFWTENIPSRVELSHKLRVGLTAHWGGYDKARFHYSGIGDSCRSCIRSVSRRSSSLHAGCYATLSTRYSRSKPHRRVSCQKQTTTELGLFRCIQSRAHGERS